LDAREILERERRWGPPAAIAAILAPLLWIGSQIGVAQLDLPTSGLATEQIRAFDANESEFLVASVVRALSFGLLCLPLFFLLNAARRRAERVQAAMLGFAFLGPLLLMVQPILSWIGQATVADDFIAMATPGGDIYTLLDDLTDDSTVLEVGTNLGYSGLLGFAVALIYIPLQAMRTGLLTRFFATLAMALGVASVLFSTLALLPAMLWFGWLGFVLLGRVPGGRPPAWEAGVAIPWPRPGEEEAERPAAPDVIEGEGAEVGSGDGAGGERDHTARRERARKRKRKRRR
jgi:hypothetical protein